MSDPVPSINSILRVNPVGFTVDDINLNIEVKEISLHKGDISKKGNTDVYETWIYEEVVDGVNDLEEGLNFSTQEDAYRGFQNWYEKSIDPQNGADSLTCLAIGGRGSGKSHTLFGQDTKSDRGIIPRFLSSRFTPDNGHQNVVSCMLITMYMVSGDTLYDLLNPPSEYSVTDHNCTYSDILGAVPLPTRSLRTETAAHGLQIIHLGLMTASMLALSRDFLFNGVDIIVSLRMFQPEKCITITFVEASTMLFLPSCIADSDRFSSHVLELKSANACADCGLLSLTAGHADTKKQSEKAQKGINGSFLTFLLQDALMLAGNPLYPTNLSACLVMGCLRGNRDSFSENKFTLDLVQTISERFQTIIEEARNGGGEDDLSSSVNRDRSLTSGGSSGQRGSRTSKLGFISGGGQARNRTATLHDDDSSAIAAPHKNMTVETLAGKIEQEILTVDTYRQKDLQVQEMSILQKQSGPEDDSRLERRLRFYNRKHKYLENILKHVKSMTLLTKKMKRHDLRVLVTWLKERGLFGIRLAKEHDANAPDYKIREITHGPADGQQEEVEISNMPWSADGMLTDPYLTPITPLNFSSSYLPLPIPAGHMAFCRSQLNNHHGGGKMTREEEKPLTFPGSKHTKTLLVDSMRVQRKHCMLFRVENTIKIRPLRDEDDSGDMMSFVEINGIQIVEETLLQDMDVIRIGSAVVFVVHIPPNDSDNEEEEVNQEPQTAFEKHQYAEEDKDMDGDSVLPLALAGGVASGYWDECIYVAHKTLLLVVMKDFLERRNIINHGEVDRAITKITPVGALNDVQKMTRYTPRNKEVVDMLGKISVFHRALLAEGILAANWVNFWAKEMKKNVLYTIHLRPRPIQNNVSFVARQYRGAELGIKIDDKLYDVAANAEVLDGGKSSGRGDSWWWSITILMQRLSLMRVMYNDFVWKYDRDMLELEDEYPPGRDPFLDPSEPELLGVCHVHLDSLFYLMDVRDTVPIVTYKGVSGGLLKFTLRCWIDEVDTIPSYIKVDEECKLSDFLGRKCIMKFYFESLLDINPALSNDLQIAFSFFAHSGQYRTPRHVSRDEKVGDEHPYLNNIVVVEQHITPEFVQYIQKKSIELEVWGGRIFNKRILKASDGGQKRKKYYLGDPKIPRSQVSLHSFGPICHYYTSYWL